MILASASPRRRELLARLVAAFEVVPADVDETPAPGEAPEETASRLADEKWRKVARTAPEAIVIAGDTVVALGDHQLGKPADAAEAIDMLRTLSGRTHRVLTALTAGMLERPVRRITTSEVRFRAIDEAEIRAYVGTGEPLDKAGAYAIQGGAAAFVEEVAGSFTNVVGLPLEALQEMLDEIRG